MKTKEINAINDWSQPWTDGLRNALKKGENSTDVGEHLVFENDDIKVWAIRLPAKQALPFHKHNKPYFYIAQSEGKSRSFYNDGRITETIYVKGNTKYFPDLSDENYFIHNLENTGNTNLLFTTIEFKK